MQIPNLEYLRFPIRHGFDEQEYWQDRSLHEQDDFGSHLEKVSGIDLNRCQFLKDSLLKSALKLLDVPDIF